LTINSTTIESTKDNSSVGGNSATVVRWFVHHLYRSKSMSMMNVIERQQVY